MRIMSMHKLMISVRLVLKEMLVKLGFNSEEAESIAYESYYD